MDYFLSAVYDIVETTLSEIAPEEDEEPTSSTTPQTSLSFDNQYFERQSSHETPNVDEENMNESFANATALPLYDLIRYRDYELKDSHSSILAHYEKQQKEMEYTMKRYNDLRNEFALMRFQLKTAEVDQRRMADRLKDLTDQCQLENEQQKSTIQSLQKQLKDANRVILRLQNVSLTSNDGEMDDRDDYGSRVLDASKKIRGNACTEHELAQFYTSQLMKRSKQIDQPNIGLCKSAMTRAVRLAAKLMSKTCVASFVKVDRGVKLISNASVVSFDNHEGLYIFGGEDYDGKINCDVIKVQLIDDGCKVSVIPTNLGSSGHASVVNTHDSSIVILGGKRTTNDMNLESKSFIQKYYVVENKWTAIEAANSLENELSAVTYGCSIDTLGANISMIMPSSASGTLEIWNYNFASSLWARTEVSQEQRQPQYRSHYSTVTYQNNLIVFGGRTSIETLSDLWMFDLDRNQWYQIHYNGYLAPNNLSSHSTVLYGDSMFVFGCTSDDIYGLWEFNFVMRKWAYYELDTVGEAESQSNRISFSDYTSVVCGNSVYIVGSSIRNEQASTAILRIGIPITVQAPSCVMHDMLQTRLLTDTEFLFNTN